MYILRVVRWYMTGVNVYSIDSITQSKEGVPLGPQKVGWSTMMSSPCAYSVMRRHMSGKSISPWLKSPRRKQGSSPIQLTCSQWAIASQSARTVWGWQYMDKIQNWSVLVCTWAAIALPGKFPFLAAVGRYRVWWWRLLLATLCDQSH